MNQGVVRSSQMVAAGAPNWWTTANATGAPPPHHPNLSFFAAAPPQVPASWNDNQDLPESCYQLLLGGESVGEEGKLSNNMQQNKKLENWEHNFLNQSSISSCGIEDEEDHVKQQENSHQQNNNFLQALQPIISSSWPYNINHHQIVSNDHTTSPKSSCVSNTLSTNNMLDFAHKFPDPNSSHECNSGGTGGPAAKKPKVNQASSAQSTFKVRKEKLGDRITALHQLVSPFGKTDTASVLLEAIGYIRFLHSQVEALSMPYLNNGSRSTSHNHHVQGDQIQRNCLFPEDPGQLLNEKCIKGKSLSEQESDGEPEMDLRSRGLCLVPVTCTLQVGNENSADYWAPAFGGNF